MRRILGGAIAILAVVGFGSAAFADDANQSSFWVQLLADQGIKADCFKHEADDVSDHGTNNGTSVTLNEFNSAWEQDFWALLVVNGGSNNNVVLYPTAGVAYFTPVNNGGQVPDVSHWFACKGYDDEVPPPDDDTGDSTTTLPVETTIPIPATTIPDLVITPAGSPEQTTTTGATVTTNPTFITPGPNGTDLDTETAIITHSENLPNTGRDQSIAIRLAIGLLVAGVIAIFITRRRVINV